MSDAQINSDVYWEGRFATDWEACGGPPQSRFFARLAVDNLPAWLWGEIGRGSLTLCDWGCAQGDGTDVLAGYVAAARLTGVDFSSVAVEQAARRYPAIRFLCEDWLSPSARMEERFDLVFSSNTLEHFHEPYKVADILSGYARKGLILVLPYRELDRIDEHFFTFLPHNLPLRLDNGFRLIWSRVVDCRDHPQTFWSGEQIILLYADRKWVDRLGLSLSDSEVAQDDHRIEPARLATALRERDDQIAGLERVAAERAGRIAGLQELLAERDGQVRSLSHTLGEREREIAGLGDTLNEREGHNQRLERRVQDLTRSTSWRLTAPLRWLGDTPPVRLLAHKARRVVQVSRERGLLGPVELGLVRVADRFRMNPYEYAFDQFVRSWSKGRPMRWKRVLVPHRPGLVSIVLPAFNGAHLLAEALDSILAQSYADIEVIAINDGSTDDTAAILDAYAARDPRVRVFHQTNQRLPKTLSRGFRLARGEFLTWTSVDNRLKPRCIELLRGALDRNPNWDMVYGNIDIIGDDGEPLRGSSWYGGYQNPAGSEHIHLPSCTSELNTWPNNYVGAAFMYRARVAWAIGDYSPVRFCTEDYDYWMRVNEVMRLRHAGFSDSIYEYRFHASSLTSRDEELGITKNRVKLMVFDEFRRSYLLSGSVWVLTTDGAAANVARAARLRARLTGRKEVIVDEAVLGGLSLPRLWLPIVLVHFADSVSLPEAAVRLPDTTTCILVAPRAQSTSPPERWDLCVTTEAVAAERLIRVAEGYRGWWSVPTLPDLLALCDLSGKNKQLGLIEAETARLLDSSTAEEEGFLSVVVCTYRRSAKLEGAIASLLGQSLAPARYEIVVVNNEPEDDYPLRVVEGLMGVHAGGAQPRILVVDCPLPGLSYARNAGLAASSGDYLIFMDDDAYADPQCLERLASAFREHPAAGVIGGHVTLAVPTPRPYVCPPGREGLWSQFLTSHRDYVEVTRWPDFPYGALWAARRVALFEMGGFRTNFGRVGADYGGGEEIVSAALAAQLGYSIGIEPRASVVHDVEEKRFTARHVVRTIVAGYRVNHDMQTSLYLPREMSFRGLVWEFISAVASSLRLVVGATFRRDRSKADLLYSYAFARAKGAVLKRRLQDSMRRFRRPAACSR